MPTGNLLDWIALNLLPGLGPITLVRALDRFGDPGRIAYCVPVQDLARLRGVGPQKIELIRKARPNLRRAEALGVRKTWYPLSAEEIVSIDLGEGASVDLEGYSHSPTA